MKGRPVFALQCSAHAQDLRDVAAHVRQCSKVKKATRSIRANNVFDDTDPCQTRELPLERTQERIILIKLELSPLSAREMEQNYGDQQQAYQEGQRQRFLNERYERLLHQENEAAQAAAAQQQAEQPADQPADQPEEQTEGFLPDNEMTDYIQEEDEEEDPYYFVQPQERPHGDIYQAARVGDVQRVR